MKKLSRSLLLLAMLAYGAPASAQQTPFLGQTMTVAFGFCPSGWVEMQGQLLDISGNVALFSLIGTTYGGDGVSYFTLPVTPPKFSSAGFVMRQCIAVSGVYPER